MMWRTTMRLAVAALAIVATTILLVATAQAGDNKGSGENHNGNHNFQSGMNSWKNPSSHNKKQSHDDHHDQGHHNHHGNHHYNHYPVVRYSVRYVPQPYPVAVAVPAPVATTIPPGGANLVDGINLKLVNVRIVDAGDAARKLGPRFRVVVGNRGKQAAGNFQVLAIAANEAKFTADLPVTMVEVEGIAPGQVAKVDVRVPIRAMTMLDGQPFNILAVVVDAKKLIEETAEQDNSGMMERSKIERVDAR